MRPATEAGATSSSWMRGFNPTGYALGQGKAFTGIYENMLTAGCADAMLCRYNTDGVQGFNK
jgi:hypothetical protein